MAFDYRCIRPTVDRSESLAKLFGPAEALFWRMVGSADPWGRLPGTARKIYAECLANVPVSTQEIEGLLEQLVRAGRIALYCELGVWVCQILDWERNQPPEVLLDCLAHESEFPVPTSESEFAFDWTTLFGDERAALEVDNSIEGLAQRVARRADTTREHRRRIAVALHERSHGVTAIGRLLSVHHSAVRELLDEATELAAPAALAGPAGPAPEERGLKDLDLKNPTPSLEVGGLGGGARSNSGSESRPFVEPSEEPAVTGAGPGESPSMSRLQDELWQALDKGLGPALTRSARKQRRAAVRELEEAGYGPDDVRAAVSAAGRFTNKPSAQTLARRIGDLVGPPGGFGERKFDSEDWVRRIGYGMDLDDCATILREQGLDEAGVRDLVELARQLQLDRQAGHEATRRAIEQSLQQAGEAA